jgi:N-acetylglucosamine malate deacetylase 1
MPSLDVLVFAPHPDDAELCCGGLLLKARAKKLTLGVIDITRGEMGTRGTPEIRQKEVAAASKLLKLQARENLGLRDGHLHDDEQLRVPLVRMLRKYRPKLLLAPHWEDQHPDHAAVGQAALYAAWLSGAPKYDPESGDGVASRNNLPYRPRQVWHYNNRYGIDADFVVDISEQMAGKLKLVGCYATQFGPGKGRKGEAQTRLSSSDFIDWLRGMHSHYGYPCGFKFGEPYCVKGPLGVREISELL